MQIRIGVLTNYVSRICTGGIFDSKELCLTYSELKINGEWIGSCHEMEHCPHCLEKSYYCEVVDPDNKDVHEYMTIGCHCCDPTMTDDKRVSVFVSFVGMFYKITSIMKQKTVL